MTLGYTLDGRHITLVSKDIEQIQSFISIFELKSKICLKGSGYSDRKYFYIQFSDVKLYRLFIKIGLTPNKSKTLKTLDIPNKYFTDFLRGCLDGDGYTYSYWDKRWKNSFMLYLGITSASRAYLEWLSGKIEGLYYVKGGH